MSLASFTALRRYLYSVGLIPSPEFNQSRGVDQDTGLILLVCQYSLSGPDTGCLLGVYSLSW